ncbi:unnamed protein product [Schistosoma turkestanicum]|nr:unnamed protein product [Schistosoma turkestanicum]
MSNGQNPSLKVSENSSKITDSYFMHIAYHPSELQIFVLFFHNSIYAQIFLFMWTILFSTVSITLVVALLLSFIIYLLYMQRSSKLPPGPVGWPLIGYISCLGTNAFYKIQCMNKIYGDIVSFRVLGKTIIILYNYDLIHEAANENRSKIGRHTMVVNDLLAENSGKLI